MYKAIKPRKLINKYFNPFFEIFAYPEKAKELQEEFDTWDSKLPDSPWWGGPTNRKR